MDSFRDFASALEPAFGNQVADTPEMLDDAEERRMQVKAYNYWTSLLGGRDFPSIEDLEPASIAEFAKHSVLIDFTSGPASATTAYVGSALRRECDLDPDNDRLADAPAGSLLARMPAYHQQILDSRAPVGFEISFNNQRGEGHAYRGILMPFSSDGDTIDFVYGVFNWNASAVTEQPVGTAPAAEAPIEDDVLELEPEEAVNDAYAAEQARWAIPEPTVTKGPEGATGPALEQDDVFELADEVESPEGVLELSAGTDVDGPDDHGEAALHADFAPEPEEWHQQLAAYSNSEAYPASQADPFAPLAAAIAPIEPDVPQAYPDEPPAFDAQPASEYEAPFEPVAEVEAAPEPEPAPMPVATITSVSIGEVAVPIEPIADEQQLSAWHDHVANDDAFAPDEGGEASLDEWLTAARATAEDAKAADGRSRQALYRALAEAYDFACAAVSAPVEYDRLLEDSGISVQARAPMTAVAKLVFGIDYDKARLTEYAAALSYGARQGIEAGEFLPFIDAMEGGLKAMVEAERRERRPTAQPAPTWRDRAISRLRSAEAQPLGQLAGNGEFALVLVRRDADGSVSPVAAVTDDALLEKAMKKVSH